MGSGSLAFLLVGRPAGAAVLAADIGSLIQNPAVLLGAAAVVVIAVLIVLIMVLRGGSRKAELAPEMGEEQEMWDSAPRGAASPSSGKGYEPRDQMLPWEQGGARADGGRQQMSGRRGPGGREAQAGWGQAAPDAQWEAQSQSAPRGGQWVGTDEWVPPEAAMGRGSADQRSQSQMRPRDNDGWAWGAGQAGSGGPPADQWNQGAASPMGRGADQWSQGPGMPASASREHEQWGQGAGSPYAMGQGVDQWGQGGAGSRPMGRENNQWGQGAGFPPAGRETDEWGQGSPGHGRGQDQWGQGAPMGRGMNQGEDQGFDQRSGPRRGAEPANPPEGQWGQGSWDQAGAGWSGSDAAGQWGQSASPAQPAQSSWQGSGSRPSGQAGMGSQPQSSGDVGGEWGGRSFSRPTSGGAQPGGSGWGAREAPAWQAESRREEAAWEAPGWKTPEPEQAGPRNGPRSQPLSQPQWEQPARPSAEPAWEGAGAASEWGQPAPAPKPNPSRPMEPAGARGMNQPAASGGGWGEQDFDRPTVKPAPQPNSWESREAPPWQPPAPQMAAAAGPVEAPPDRSGPDMRQLGKASPESTAYAPPAAGGDDGAAEKTVVMRKDAGAGRIPAVVVRQGKEPGRTYDVRKDHISIGRSRESDIFLEDLAVSRLHATIYRDEMGGYLLRDENSANGTSVNGRRVTECALQEGDEIQLGQTILAFVRR